MRIAAASYLLLLSLSLLELRKEEVRTPRYNASSEAHSPLTPSGLGNGGRRSSNGICRSGPTHTAVFLKSKKSVCGAEDLLWGKKHASPQQTPFLVRSRQRRSVSPTGPVWFLAVAVGIQRQQARRIRGSSAALVSPILCLGRISRYIESWHCCLTRLSTRSSGLIHGLPHAVGDEPLIYL